MTNERAKEVLQEQIDRYGQEYDAEGIEALEIAIKVLEQTSCKSDARRWKRRYLDLKQRVIKLEEQTKWIPVSKRLPEDDGWYLCTICNDIETKVAQIRYFENRGWKAYGWRITAWMNEPQPYIEREGEK